MRKLINAVNLKVTVKSILVLMLLCLLLFVIICQFPTSIKSFNVKSSLIEGQKNYLNINHKFEDLFPKKYPVIDQFKKEIMQCEEVVQQRCLEMELLAEMNEEIYATSDITIYTLPFEDSQPINSIVTDQCVIRKGVCRNGWSKILIDDVEGYLNSDYVTTQAPLSYYDASASEDLVTLNSVEYSPEDLYNLGVIYDSGYKYTWYSEQVLPGGGLDIPGRWSDGNFVRDIHGNLCVASSDFTKGTVLNTPWGIAVVYDTGCASGTIDIYVFW